MITQLSSSAPLVAETSVRAAAIADFGFDHGSADPHLDRLCRHVAAACNAPIALISLVEEDEQRFLGRAGTDLTGTARSTSFCATAMVQSAPLIVPDATADARFADFAIVTGSPYVRFYAGVALVTPEGVPLGALCLLDTVPRPAGLTDAQLGLLEMIAAAVMDRLLLRRAQLLGEAAAHAAARALDQSELRFRILADAMPQMVWSARPDGYVDFFNAQWCDYTCQQEAVSHGFAWTSFLHPDDLAATREVWARSVKLGEPYDIQYRLRRHDGEYRWSLARGLPMRDASGTILRWFGTCTDIHEQKLALEAREVISQELSHRIKNIFAVISGLISLAARDDSSFEPTAESLRARILALGRAHDFVRPHSLDSQPGPDHNESLRGLLHQLFAPYEDHPGARVRISGDDVPIDERSATPLSLLFHELATNAAKYGALSNRIGHVDVVISKDGADSVDIRWRERGGPPVITRKPAGFGSQLLDLSVRRQLGGRFSQTWHDDGMEMIVSVPAAAFARRILA